MEHHKKTTSFWDMALDKIKSCKKESDRFFHIGKVKLDKTFLEKDKQQLLNTLGQKTLNLVEDGKIKNAELKSLCQKIIAIDTQIDNQDNKLKDITHSRLDTETAVQEDDIPPVA